ILDPIMKFSSDGELLAKWDPARGGSIYGLALDSAGNIYASLTTDQIQKLSPEGEPLAAWGIPHNQQTPYGGGNSWDDRAAAIAARGDAIYVRDAQHQRIVRLGREGTPLLQWENTTGSQIALGANGHVYVSEPALRRISEFTGDGTMLAQRSTGTNP